MDDKEISNDSQKNSGASSQRGLGWVSLGAVLAGWLKDATDLNTNYVFAALSILASIFGILLIAFNRSTDSEPASTNV